VTDTTHRHARRRLIGADPEARDAETAAPDKIQFNGCRRIANLHQLHAHGQLTVTLIAWKQRIGKTSRCTLKEKYPCW
jgi:hypothetical protein